MIQRIQTVYFFLVATLAVLLLTVDIPFYEISRGANDTGEFVSLNFTNTITYSGQTVTSVTANTAITVVICLLLGVSLFAILSFKNRKLQKMLSLLGMFCVIVLAGTLFYSVASVNVRDSEAGISWGIFLIVLIPFLFFGALRGIRNDEALLRSLNSIR